VTEPLQFRVQLEVLGTPYTMAVHTRHITLTVKTPAVLTHPLKITGSANGKKKNIVCTIFLKIWNYLERTGRNIISNTKRVTSWQRQMATIFQNEINP